MGNIKAENILEYIVSKGLSPSQELVEGIQLAQGVHVFRKNNRKSPKPGSLDISRTTLLYALSQSSPEIRDSIFDKSQGCWDVYVKDLGLEEFRQTSLNSSMASHEILDFTKSCYRAVDHVVEVLNLPKERDVFTPRDFAIGIILSHQEKRDISTDRLLKAKVVLEKALENLKNGVEGLEKPQVRTYWWHNANPEVISLDQKRPGITFKYPYRRTPENKKFEVLENVLEARPGDRVIGYQSFGIQKCILELEIVSIERKTNRENSTIVFHVERVFDNQLSFKELVEKGNLNFVDDITQGTLRPLSEEVFSKSTKLLSGPDIAQPEDIYSAKTKSHSDRWAEKDLLEYELFADTIAKIIRDEESRPPLNIAVIAPWGQGKTTLMKYIENRFPSPSQKGERDRYNTSLSRFSDFLKSGDIPIKRLKYPTVWFNPWKYQSSKQIWAGMGHAIITQLVEKLDPVNQELFWMKLQIKRIDKNRVRSEINKFLFKGFSTRIVLFFLLLVTPIVLILSNILSPIGIPTWLAGFLPAGSFVEAARSFFNRLTSGINGDLTTFVQSPKYEDHLGLYHEINEDINKVFDLLIDNEKPAVIFVDDLDRCSPTIVAEVVEAINLIMNNPTIGENCYFIIGMDAQMVAASLDTYYKSFAGKFEEEEKQYGSVGWYFLDKFVQLPFFIPVMQPNSRSEYLETLFSKQNEDESLNEPIEVREPVKLARASISHKLIELISFLVYLFNHQRRKNLLWRRSEDVRKEKELFHQQEKQYKSYTKKKKIYDEAKAKRDAERKECLYAMEKDIEILFNCDDEKRREIMEKYKDFRHDFDKIFLRKSYEKNFDSEEIRKQVNNFSAFINPSPRHLKRFANLLRFYIAHQQLRQVKSKTNNELQFASSNALAKWLVINLQWPQLVRWVQWETEENLLQSNLPKKKAEFLDTLVDKIKNKHSSDDVDHCYKSWLEELDSSKEERDWITDKDLFKLLYLNNSEPTNLINALKCNVW